MTKQSPLSSQTSIIFVATPVCSADIIPGASIKLMSYSSSLDNKSNAELLSRMAYDGRERNNIPWSEQDITVIGYHYYMTPDKAILGLKKFKGAILKVPKTITYKTYPDLTKKKIFNVR